jgi:hypothetical protein
MSIHQHWIFPRRLVIPSLDEREDFRARAGGATSESDYLNRPFAIEIGHLVSIPDIPFAWRNSGDALIEAIEIGRGRKASRVGRCFDEFAAIKVLAGDLGAPGVEQMLWGLLEALPEISAQLALGDFGYSCERLELVLCSFGQRRPIPHLIETTLHGNSS